MKDKTQLIGVITLSMALILAACANNNEQVNENSNNTEANSESNMEGMNHSGSAEVPEELQKSEDPTYPEGSTAIIEANHMKGMEGAEATIVGAYDTTAYVVTYTPEDGGEPVENHKWVIHEELEDPDEAPLPSGTEVTLMASHMEGMKGAIATVESATETTVYMIDYTPTTGGEKVTNHKWVTEDELTLTE
ncbi:YdhK family protein [Alkalihalobacillus hwajinpoensis]|uniref:YdhK family protein n=1 Tax=Guptibacillus hwajinpoensis TaxID=208199 RepID=UPI0018837135|nr:YdhK family protein [Pseudalkalibacillus hwajinpoensis]MBF0708818.1 YdhK family protein [Pseudalkalibacillus hwajinpoensis]